MAETSRLQAFSDGVFDRDHASDTRYTAAAKCASRRVGRRAAKSLAAISRVRYQLLDNWGWWRSTFSFCCWFPGYRSRRRCSRNIFAARMSVSRRSYTAAHSWRLRWSSMSCGGTRDKAATPMNRSTRSRASTNTGRCVLFDFAGGGGVQRNRLPSAQPRFWRSFRHSGAKEISYNTMPCSFGQNGAEGEISWQLT